MPKPRILPANCHWLTALSVGALLIHGCSRSGLLTAEESGVVPLGCTEGTVELSRAQPTIMFLLDRSISMGQPMGGSSDARTRWQALRNGLALALPDVDQNARIGALFFPSTNAGGGCEVAGVPQLLPDHDNVAPLVSLMEELSPTGATPIASALDSAARTLLGTRASTSARAMVLATDGGPNCNASLQLRTCRCAPSLSTSVCRSSAQCLDDQRTLQRIATYRAQGVLTYVIGVESEGDNEYSDVLDAMAVAGGTARADGGQKYYPACSQEQLDAVLTGIGRVAGYCVYLTSSVPDTNGSIELNLDGVPLDEDQWAWQQKSNGEIVLGAKVCDQLLDKQSPVLLAQVSCGTPGLAASARN